MNIEYYIKEFGEVRIAWVSQEERESNYFNRTIFFQEKFKNKKYIENLSWEDIKDIAGNIHGFDAHSNGENRAINSLSNKGDIQRFKRNFKSIIQPLGENKYADLKQRFQSATRDLKYWGSSTISEIIGQCHPNDVVFYKFRDREATKFLLPNLDDYTKRKKTTPYRYIGFQKAVQENIIPLYKEHLWNFLDEKKRYPIGLEIDLFLSWIYKKYVKEESNLIQIGKETEPIIFTYLDKISIKNYFSIKNIEINKLGKYKEIYLLGENGVGKTLFLQAIILATKWYYADAFDTETAGVLSSYSRNDENKDLEIKMIGNDNNEEGSSVFHLSNIKDKQDDFINIYLKNIYAYGVNRSVNKDKKSTKSDKVSTREYLTLFKNQAELEDPIEWLIKLYNNEREIEFFQLKNPNKSLPENLSVPPISLEKIIFFLKEILGGHVKINITYDNVIFQEFDTKVTIDQLSDGYKSVFIWVMDLIIRLCQNQSSANHLKDFKGIVLVDELDLFLHVKWAQNIVSILRKAFEGIQFIITTHSPILVLSASKDAVFYKLYKEDGETKITEPIKGLSDLMLNGLVTSPLFGLSSARSKVFKDVENISNDDYITFRVHQALSKRMEKEPSATEDEFMKWVEMELEKELANENQ